jgi:hypothetical protein
VLQSGSRGKINASCRIPYYSKSELKELHTVALGSIIECSVKDADAAVRLDCAFESSYVAPDQPAQQRPVGFPPVVNSRQVQMTAAVPPGSIDDQSSGNSLTIFVLAERLADTARDLEQR